MRACTYCHQLLSDGDALCPRDGSAPHEVELARVPGQLHARFPAIEPFACGGTGSSFLAVQAQSGFRGLLKILAPAVAASAAERARLKRELRKQTTLTNNALARIIDGGEIGADLWLFRDFVQGESLAVRLRRGPLPVPEALAVAAQVASALDEVHRQGLLHRDVKPGHVLLSTRVDAVPLVTVIDAGVAARLPSDSVFELLGTAAYVAPEVLAGKPASFRSDLYALGCVLHEMLSGAPPFVADTTEAVLAAHRDVEPKELDLELPAAVRSLLSSLLAKEPRRRPFSAQQVRRTLDPYLPATTPEPSSGTRTLAGTVTAPRVSEPPPRMTPDPKAGARGSQPTPPRTSGPPVPPVAARGALPPVPAAMSALSAMSGMPRVEATQEIDIADVESPSSPMLTPADSDIEIEPPTEPGLEAQHVDSSEQGPASEASLVSDVEPTRVMLRPAEFMQPMAAETSAPAETAHASSAAADPAPAPRKAVDFDVESLFDDDVDAKPPVVSAPAAAPPAAAPPAPARASVPPPVFGSVPVPPLAFGSGSVPPPSAAVDAAPVAAEASSVAPDPEGTVLTRRRASAARKPRPWGLIGAAALLIVVVVVFALRSGGREHSVAPQLTAAATPEPTPQPTAAAAAADQHPAPAAAAPSAAQPPQPAQPAGPAEGTVAANPAPPAAPQAAPAAPAAAPSPPSAASAEAERVESAKTASKAKSTGSPVHYKSPPAAEPGVDYKAKGRELFSAGKYKEAATAYERATQQTPSDAGAFAGLGASCLQSSQPDKAILAYQRAVQLKPDSSGFHAALARAYMQKGDRGRAAAAYKKALELDPNNQSAKTALAVLGN